MPKYLFAVFAVLVAPFSPCLTQAADEENPFKKAKVGDYSTPLSSR